MTIDKNIRLATETDCEAILKIYAPFIRDTVITFEYDVPTISEFNARFSNITKQYPWLVCEIDGVIVGYAYASKYSERRAYDWSVDSSIYIHPGFHRKGIAKALYYCLFELLKHQGFYNVYAGITESNTISDQFHESFGFKPVGVYHHVGFKFGKWLDVKWLERTLNESTQLPAKTKAINDIKDTPEFEVIISKALHMIKD